MTHVQRSQVWRYGIPVLSVLVSLLLSLLLDKQAHLDATPLFFVAVVLSSWYGGLRSGLLATVLATGVKNIFFVVPLYSVKIATSTDLLELAIFGTVALFISSCNAELQTAKQRADDSLAKLQLGYRRVLETANEGIWIVDRDGQTEYVNQQLALMLGYRVEELVNRSIFNFIDRPSQIELEQWLAQQKQKIGDIKQQFDVRLHRSDASDCWAIVSISSIVNKQGECTGAIAMLTDITERKQQEIALQEKEKRFSRLVESNIFGIGFGSFSGNIHYANDAFLKMVGYEQDDVLSGRLRWDEITPPEFLHLDQQAQVELRKHGTCTPFEKEYIRKDGSRVPILIGAALLEEPYDRQQDIVAFFLDLTTRKQAEAALRQKQEWLDLAQTAAKLGSFEWNIQTNINTWSKELEALYGLQPGEFGGTYDEWKQRVYPEDLAKAEADVLRSLKTGEFFTDFRVVWRDGSVHWLYARARVLFDQEGHPLRMVGVNVDVTDRKQAELALQQSEARLRRIVDSNMIGIFFGDLDGNIKEANDAFLQILGYSRQDLRAGHIRWDSLTPPEHLERTEQAVAELVETGIFSPFEKEFFHKDGSRVWVELGGALFDGGQEGVCYVIDQTDRKHAEAAMYRSELLFRTLADTMPQMFWITQPDGYHEYFNRRWYDYTGATLEQTQGEGWQQILHPDDVQRTIAVWQNSLQTGTTYDIEYRLRRSLDGEYRWHLGRAFPLRNQDGQILKWFGSCTDIHDQKLAIEERAQALERERATRLELEKANRMKEEFLAIVSHELRSPLNPILGWSKLLLSQKLDEAKTTQALEIIERNAKLQTRLIEDLLDVSRILQGKLSLNLGSVDLVTTIEAALETVYLAAEAKSIHLQTQFEPIAGTIKGDANRLQQVVGNLLTNAVKFTPSAGQVIVRLEQVWGGGGDGGDGGTSSPSPPSSSSLSSLSPTPPTPQRAFARLTVADTGKGISPEFLPYVFERFRQADDTTTRKFGGLGLGLAIVRHIVEIHGGSVHVASRGEGQGATFTVMLPLAVTPLQRAEDARLRDDSPNLEGVRILVVDDDVDNLELLVFILEQYGADVEAMTSAREAFETIATAPPNVLLSDIAMPETDGYILIHQVRTLEASRGGRLPAIALTAFAGELDHNKIISAGFERHLTKPVEPEQLAAAIAKLVTCDRFN